MVSLRSLRFPIRNVLIPLFPSTQVNNATARVQTKKAPVVPNGKCSGP